MIIYDGGNKNYPDSINVMVNYHYHSENRVCVSYAVEKYKTDADIKEVIR